MSLITNYGELAKLKIPVTPIPNNLLESRIDDLIKAKDALTDYLNNEPKAFGISAVQLGIDIPMFAMRMKDGIENFINPEIRSQDTYYINQEGCMSFPDILIHIFRYKNINVFYKRLNYKNELKEYSRDLKENESAAFQHENDHLRGVTIIDKAVPLNEEDLTKEDKSSLEKVYRDEDKLDYFIEGENIYFFSGEPVLDHKIIIVEEKEVKAPITKSVIGIKHINKSNESNSENQS